VRGIAAGGGAEANPCDASLPAAEPKQVVLR
jgi:hypothetical protein